MKIIQVAQNGGPEVLKVVDAPTPSPGPKQALIRVAASGVNFIDVYFRIGLYKADLPFTPGNEGAGTVEAVGPEVTEVKPGDRVAWAMHRGSYGEYAVVPSAQLVRLPDGLDFNTAAAAMLQGMTAHYLTHSSFPLKKGDKCLIHAAAGGAGRLAVQMAKMLGATVYGTAGTDQKAEIAKSAGADEVIVYTRQDFVAEVKRFTDGKGVDVVYDSVGASTFLKGLDLIRPRGMMVLFGQSSGAVPPFDPSILNQKGSLFLTRPSLAHHCLTREELLWRAGDVLGWIASGKLELRIEKTYALAEAPQAHRDLESRKTAGKLLLIP
ncbi:MAG TPA: quinone oxidoreductase [Bryobacteraceae bacterium]|nr:quinone oxidoreductase [Bryobacteraceae bacterium]